MLFTDILSQNHIKKQLTENVDKGRVPHAQLFVGKSGYGVLPTALALSQYILCKNKNQENSGGHENCNLKCNQFSHPDLHFVFPVTKNEKVKKHPVSKLFLEEWREFLNSSPYGDIMDWYAFLGVDNKQGLIGVDEAAEIIKTLSLKSFEGGDKIMIIWTAEKMNSECSNKLLKLIEEPPKNTFFILITEDENKILPTIKSRCQITRFLPLNKEIIISKLQKKFNLDPNKATQIANQSDGDYRAALKIYNTDEEILQFEEWFIKWVRTAFSAKGNKTAIIELITWSELIAKTGRETQKNFLNYCLQFFRQALLSNYSVSALVNIQINNPGFKLEKFAPFIHSGNIIDIASEIEQAIFHIERNGNSKIILSDLSIKLTRLIHQTV